MNIFIEIARANREYLEALGLPVPAAYLQGEDAMPVYKARITVADKSHAQGEVTVTRVVEAANVAQARSHLAKDFIALEVCDTAEAMRLAGEGVKLEQVKS